MSYRQILENNRERTIILHYSCSDIKCNPCKISCVVLRDEFRHKEDVYSRRTMTEEKILKEVWDAITKNNQGLIVGWNIKNSEFGLNVLKERYKEILGKEPTEIASDHIIDIDEAIKRDNKLSRQKLSLKQLADINNYQTVNFKDGKDELELFKSGDFKTLELSVSRKTRVIGDILGDFITSELVYQLPETLYTANIEKYKVLFLAANPKDADTLALGKELRLMKEAVQSATYREKVIFIGEGAVRTNDLQRHLNTERPNIVHISGHGTERCEICLLDNHDNAYPYPQDALADVFKLFRDDIVCVVLNTCNSYEQAVRINEYIKYVIGSPVPIDDDNAIEFSRAFYFALASDKSIEHAYNQGLNILKARRTNPEEFPILLVHRCLNPATRKLSGPIAEASINITKAKEIAIQDIKSEKDILTIEVESVKKTAGGWIVRGEYTTNVYEDMPFTFRFEIQLNEKGEILSQDLNYNGD